LLLQFLSYIRLLVGARVGAKNHFAFFFSETVSFPPNVHDMKPYYISSEMLRRRMKVTWIMLGDELKVQQMNAILFVMIPRIARRFRKASLWIGIMIASAFCKFTKVSGVYIDEWLFFRGDPAKLISYISALKKTGVKFIFDQRDPYIDFEISCGKIEPNDTRYKILRNQYKIIYDLSDLVIVPSHQYMSVMIEQEGVPATKVLGIFRGIDSNLFNTKVSKIDLIAKGSQEKKFIVGWFGIMHPYRKISEVLVPLIKSIGKIIPNAHVVIGGEGPSISEFESLIPAYSEWFSMLGFVPYSDLPKYISSCDVLLCPVDTRFRFSRSSLWLKIFETVAVGRPMIATRTDASVEDASSLGGVIWVEGTLDSYLSALEKVHSNYQTYQLQALEQAKHFEEFATSRTIPKIVDAIVAKTTQ
jgi:glycosyltransferase involved in cell wall biosynthesis